MTVRQEPLSRRFTVVVAAAGYGKTTAIRRWLGTRPARWWAASGQSAADAPDLAAPIVVVDGVGDAAFLEPLVASLPARTRLVLAARAPLGGAVARWRAAGQVADITAADLASGVDDVAALLTARGADPGHAAALHDRTGGWPALVRLAADALADSGIWPGEPLDPVTGPQSAYLLDEVLPSLPVAAQQLVHDLAELPSVSPELVAALAPRRRPGTGGHAAALRLLKAVGLLGPADRGYRLLPAVAAAVRAGQRPVRRTAVLSAATRWYAASGAPAHALTTALALGDGPGCAALLARHGPDLLRGGGAARVVDVVRALDPADRDAQVELVFAEALLVTGEVDDALAAFARLAGDAPTLPAALAWRYGMARYLHGEADTGLTVLLRGRVPAAPDPDGALLLAWTAAAYWRQGDAAACGKYAERAHQVARAVDDARATAAAHVALALHGQITGDRPAVQAHYDRALTAARSGGDAFAEVRIRTNRASSLIQEARYAEALAIVQPAAGLAERCGYLWLLAIALANEGEALAWLGRVDEAVLRHERAISLWQKLYSDKVAYALVSLADVHRRRGRTSQARAAYEEAVRLAGAGRDRQALVPALAGLARVLAATDPGQAAAVAADAVAQAHGPWLTTALLASGWAAAGDDAARARGWAAQAAASARSHRDPAGLAEALELTARVVDDPAEAARALTEALAIWRDAGAILEADRVQVLLGTHTGRPEHRMRAALAAGRLAAAGVMAPLEDQPGPPAVEVRALGRFAVVVGGAPVPPAGWQSRKARDLLRILVARRGRTIARDELAGLLWGDEPAERVAHRLSVALSTLRAVLDPDRRAPADHFVRTDASGLSVDPAAVQVDADVFTRYAEHGFAALRAGRPGEAAESLAAAERLYLGDFGEDEPYDDHGRAVREELRATFLQVTRVLAGLSRQDGHPDDAVRYLLRVLGVDPYDEASHRELIDVLAAHGRHGEAQRARTRYRAAMAEIGVRVPD